MPLTLLQLTAEHEMAIVEMGANHPNEIGELCAIAAPDMGLITNIGKAHLEGFGGLEGVIKTKKELYDYIRIHKGQLFVNGADALLCSLSEGIERVMYNAPNASCAVSVSGAIPALTLSVTQGEELWQIQTHMVGEYNCINVAAVVEIGHYLGISMPEMINALESYTPSNNRSQILNTQQNQVILDAYNANPASMSVALVNFLKLDVPHKVVMLGAMKELGKYSIAEHQAIVETISNDAFEIKIVVGEEFSSFKEGVKDILFFDDVEAVKAYLVKHPLQNHTVLVKGSRSMKMEMLIDVL